jgi:hypothetical protein
MSEAMPGAVEMSVHYDSYGDFKKGQAEMAGAGWQLEGFSLVGAPGGVGRFVGLGRQAVDAHYIRDAWPTE